MTRIGNDVIIATSELLNLLDVCAEAKAWFEVNNLWNNTERVVVAQAYADGHDNWVEWWYSKKITEVFVRNTGVSLIMGDYKVFNPLTSQYSTYATLAEAKLALEEIAQLVLQAYTPTASQMITNENGDTSWTSTDLHVSLKVVFE